MRSGNQSSNFGSFVIYTLLAAAIFFLLRSALWRFNPSTVVFTDDFTVSLAVAKLFLNGEHTLLGPPCHVAGRHLGPIYYWYLSALLWLAQEDAVRTAVLCTITKLGALAVVFGSLWFFCRRTALALGILGAALVACSGQFVWVLRKPWHMHFMLLPATAIFVAAFLCIQKGPRYFLPFVLCAFLLVQTHFGAAPVAAELGLVVLLKWVVDGYWECRAGRATLGAVVREILRTATGQYRWIWGVVAVLSWAPLAIYEYRYGGNLRELFEMQQQQIKGSAGANVAWSVFYQFTRRLVIGTLPVSSLDGWTAALWRLTLLISLCGAAGLLMLSYIRKATAEQRWCVAALVVPCVGMFAALFAASPPVYLYYLNALLPVPLLLVGIVCSEVASLLWSHAGREQSPTRNAPYYLKISLCAAFLAPFAYLKTRDLSQNILQFRAHFLPVQNLSHASSVASVLAANTPAGSHIVIDTLERTSQNKNGYYYLLTQQPLFLMKYSKYFKDLPSFAAPQPGSTGSSRPSRTRFLVMCPGPSPAWQAAYERGHGKRLGLAFDTRWPIPNDANRCEVVRLRKSEDPPIIPR